MINTITTTIIISSSMIIFEALARRLSWIPFLVACPGGEASPTSFLVSGGHTYYSPGRLGVIPQSEFFGHSKIPFLNHKPSPLFSSLFLRLKLGPSLQRPRLSHHCYSELYRVSVTRMTKSMTKSLTTNVTSSSNNLW